MISLNARKNIIRDISILSGYLIHENYSKVSREIMYLSIPRIRVIVRDLFKIFSTAIGYGWTYDVINDTMTITSYLHMEIFQLIQKSQKLYKDDLIYGKYWNQLPSSVGEYMERVDKVYNIFKGNSLLKNSIYYAKDRLIIVEKHFADNERKNDSAIHNSVMDILSTYNVCINPTHEKHLYSISNNSTLMVGDDSYLLCIKYSNYVNKSKFCIYNDGRVSYIVDYLSIRTEKERDNYIKLNEKVYINISK